MRKLKLINGDLVESAGLAKNKLKEDSFYSVLRGTIKGEYKGNPDEITEGIYEITPYISALRLYRDKEAFINHCFGIIERVYTSQCDSETIKFAKEVIVTMVERDKTVGGLSCSKIMKEIESRIDSKS